MRKIVVCQVYSYPFTGNYRTQKRKPPEIPGASPKFTDCYSSAVMPEKVLTFLVILKTLSVVLMPLGVVSVSMTIEELPPVPRENTVVPVLPVMVSVSQPSGISGVTGAGVILGVSC